MNDISSEFERITGLPPYRWQRRLVESGLPETLEIPTGCGKTEAVFMAWAYRRRLHPDLAVRAATPRRLVIVLPQRSLVEQTRDRLTNWAANAGWADADTPDHLPIHVLMGGESVDRWQLAPHKDAVIVGTLDMVLSRSLNRGYAMNRYAWPVDFGLLNNDCHYVLDEVQLMGAAVTTSRQMDAFRHTLGTAIPCTTTWMSATLDPERLSTVDNPTVAKTFALLPDEMTDQLAERLGAKRTVARWLGDDTTNERPDKKQLPSLRAKVVADRHRPGTLTLVVVNQVDVARELHKQLNKLVIDGTELVLLHSRYRPADRAEQMRKVLAVPPAEGTVVVTTQVVEAGVDLNATTLFTESAPWSSIVQRSGRCNRDGKVIDAHMFWDPPVSPAPYDIDDAAAAEAQLTRLTGHEVTTGELDALEVAESGGEEPLVLRRRDLLGLFDTTPDLTGNDLDIAPFLRSGDDLSVWVCWRDLAEDGQRTPNRDELCQVPVGQLTAWLKKKSSSRKPTALRLEHVGRRTKTWVNLGTERVRPGMVLMVNAALGGYSPDTGWDPAGTQPVPPPRSAAETPPAGSGVQPDMAPLDEREGDDPATYAGRWMTLEQHLQDAGNDAHDLLAAMDTPGLDSHHRAAAIRAARLHDLGKAHPVFQATLKAAAGEDPIPIAGPWAKSGSSKRAHHSRPYFRHELVSALALLGGASSLLDGYEERSLICYLTAAHHGKVRTAIRSMPEERLPDEYEGPPGSRIALGVIDGDELPAVTVDGQVVGPMTLDLMVMGAGGTPTGPSWTSMAQALVDRTDLGPFRLGFLEAIVRVADWRASAMTEANR